MSCGAARAASFCPSCAGLRGASIVTSCRKPRLVQSVVITRLSLWMPTSGGLAGYLESGGAGRLLIQLCWSKRGHARPPSAASQGCAKRGGAVTNVCGIRPKGQHRILRDGGVASAASWSDCAGVGACVHRHLSPRANAARSVVVTKNSLLVLTKMEG
ncbi:hypothetical protein T492DRAFT_836825 [Pavlovales sp. CCMP2436]|nr:hypothetical protein T492DRAFT_836825 [Pavlovales sp. CCMP2436]